MNQQNSRNTVSFFGFLLLVLFSLSMQTKVFSQVTNERISQAIQASNAQELSKFFNNSIDLTIPGSEGTYSKVQAEQIINSFFTKFPITAYTLNHKGESNDGSMYAIGTYKSGNKTFRTYYLSKPVNGVLLIHQLKFESREE